MATGQDWRDVAERWLKDTGRASYRSITDAQAMGELTATAREGRTQPAETAGGTVTIALVSLAVAGIPIVTTMGLMAATRAGVAVSAAGAAAGTGSIVVCLGGTSASGALK